MAQMNTGTLPLSIYPNPAHNTLHVSMDKVQGLATVRIFNLLRKTLYQATVYVTASCLNTDINISQFSSGMYIVEVTTAKGTNKNRFLKY